MFRLRITKNIGIELWADIPGYEGLYQASIDGKIKSMLHNYEFILKPRNVGKKFAYRQVNILGKEIYVHKLVWTTFSGAVPDKYDINHIDEDPSNNALWNLNLLSRSDNLRWGTSQIRRICSLNNPHINQKCAEKVKQIIPKQSKEIVQYNLNMEYIKTYNSGTEAEIETGIDSGDISRCCRGIRKTAGGYKWKFSI